MLVFDQLKKDDPQLRFLAIMVLAGMLVLLAGLWWVQAVSTDYYQEKLETQSIRTVRIPAVRGRILDRELRPLAENLPRYNVDLYLEELSRRYQTAYTNSVAGARRYLNQKLAEYQRQIGRKLTPQEKKRFALPSAALGELQKLTRYEVTSNIIADLSARMQMPIELSEKDFQKQYNRARALPITIVGGLNPSQLARFEEESVSVPGVDMEVHSIRNYPHGSLAAHVLGYLIHDNESAEGELAEYNYRLDDYEGISGIEKVFDKELRGTAGAKSVLVNNLGYRQSETIWTAAEPGQDVVLTLDLDIQKAAEEALRRAMPDVRGAVVVMDTQNGDVLAMASAPSFNPNDWIKRPAPEMWAAEMQRWNDPELGLQLNRAMQQKYAPGSIFKIVTGLAALEQGVLNPKEIFQSEGFYKLPGRSRPIGDTAGPGKFDFDSALAHSSNPYFITQGLKPGVLGRILLLGSKLHFGELTGLIPRQETGGDFPTQKTVSHGWYLGDTAYLSIGQGKIAVTPLQIAVMISAVANGGEVFYPRLVSCVVPYDSTEPSETFQAGRLRDRLEVSPRHLGLVREAMLQDVEGGGTGKRARVDGLQIAGKTGTAEVEKNGHLAHDAKITWFASFAPAGPGETPRYAVVAMVEGGDYGGTTCAPIAHDIYEAILQKQRKPAPKRGTLAEIR